MDLSDYLRTESSAFTERLLAAVEERTRQLRQEADDVRTQKDALRADLERETARAASLEADLENVIEAHRAVDAERGRLETDLESVIAAHSEVDGARARLEEELQRTRQLVESARSEADRLLQSLERETAQHALVRDELATAQSQLESLDAARIAADERIQQLQTQLAAAGRESERAASLQRELEHALTAQREADAHRVRLEEELRGTRELVQSARAEAERLSESLEHETAQIALVRDELTTTREHVVSVESARATAEERVRLLEERLTEAEAHDRALREQLAVAQDEQVRLQVAAAAAATAADATRQDFEAEIARLQQNAERAGAETDALRQQAVARDTQAAAATQLLDRSVGAIDALSRTASVDALFQELVVQASACMPRVALFRARGNHLQGERGVGIDDAVDITKLMIPTSVDSLVARAVASGTLVRADHDQLAAAAPPLGGNAGAAIAVPIVLDDQPFAVLYADSPDEISAAEATVTFLLARHTHAVLARLAREFKAMEELREYAAMLVDEAAQIFHADLESGCPKADRLLRLKGSLDYARELYAHRAAVEGRSAVSLFDKHLAEVGEQDSEFGQALTDLLDDVESHKTA